MEFVCQHCNIIFKSNSGLWKHNNKHHNENNKKEDIQKIEKIFINFIQIIYSLKYQILYLRKGTLLNKDEYNQQIELVKGSSSTLYGGGAIAGMLNLISKKPKLNKPETSLTLNTSSANESNINIFTSARNKNIGYTKYYN